MTRARRLVAVTVAAGALALGAAALGLSGLAFSQGQDGTAASAARPATPSELFTAPLVPGASAQVAQGRDLVIAADCVACHTRPDGAPLAGGLGLKTPFGVFYSPNITSDAQTGIGAWTPDAFYRALHEGVGDHDKRLYPAFPYPYFTHITRADSDAMLAYLKTTPAVAYTPPADAVAFPLNIRFLMRGWNLLFFRPATYQADGSRSAQWNRGAYLVEGPGHCGVCHTPMNSVGAAKTGQALYGGRLNDWVAPNLTGEPRVGLGSWSPAEVVAYLKTGRNARAQAAGPMAEAVSDSTSLMGEADLQAIAAYLKSVPASPAPSAEPADAGAMQRGAAVYEDACASCHLMGGAGQPGYFPPLKGDAMAQQADPTGLVHLILAGGRTAPTPTAPTPLSMPSFAWKLTDAEVADVSTYIRNAWGNAAAPVGSGEVGPLRRRLGLDQVRLTANSGDHRDQGGDDSGTGE